VLNSVSDNPSAPRLSIVIPAYNEEDRLRDSLVQIADYLSRQPYTYDAIVSDDGSKDTTVNLAESFASDHPWLRTIQHPDNHGKGMAVRRGMLEASGDYILMCDADLATPIEELDGFWRHIEEGADIVIASRPLRGSHLVRRQPIYREMAGRMLNLLVRMAAVPGIRDTQCGFKLFRGDVAHRLFSMSVREGWDFDIEILYLARRLGYRIVEVPVHWYHREGSKVNFLRDGIRMVIGLFRIRSRHVRIKGTVRNADR
jgi:dolichyl-phosphate beta-glucosyltransferase